MGKHVYFSEKCFFFIGSVFLIVPRFGCSTFTVQNDVQCVRSLTLEGCFHIQLLERERFFVLTSDLNSRRAHFVLRTADRQFGRRAPSASKIWK